MTTSKFDEQWLFVLNHSDEHIQQIAERAFKEPSLRCLFPYPSMSNLRFSKTSEYPYDNLPYILSASDAARYEVRDADNRPLAEGDLEIVIPALVGAIRSRP